MDSFLGYMRFPLAERPNENTPICMWVGHAIWIRYFTIYVHFVCICMHGYMHSSIYIYIHIDRDTSVLSDKLL